MTTLAVQKIAHARIRVRPKVKIPNKETQKALREDMSTAKRYANVDTLFDDILGKDWRTK